MTRTTSVDGNAVCYVETLLQNRIRSEFALSAGQQAELKVEGQAEAEEHPAAESAWAKAVEASSPHSRLGRTTTQAYTPLNTCSNIFCKAGVGLRVYSPR